MTLTLIFVVIGCKIQELQNFSKDMCFRWLPAIAIAVQEWVWSFTVERALLLPEGYDSVLVEEEGALMRMRIQAGSQVNHTLISRVPEN